MIKTKKRPKDFHERRYRRKYKGFPKQLPCLVCGRLKRTFWPGERIHFNCKREYTETAE